MYLTLLLTFSKIGIMTFGGGYAMLPIIQREIVENKGWVTEEEIMDYYAIGQCTPGVIAVNVATFVGYKMKGFLGALSCTVGVILPSFFIISVIAGLITKFANLDMVQHAFAGIRIAVCALVSHTIIRLAAKSIKDALTVMVALGAFVAVGIFSVSPFWIVIAVVFIGLVFIKGAKA